MISKRVPKTTRDRRGGNRKHWPWPAWRTLFHGCVREALAAVNSTARIGIQDTNAWQRPIGYVSDDGQVPISYVSDDNCGNVGIIEFLENGIVAAVNAKERSRIFDQRAIHLAPLPRYQDALKKLCDLPPLNEFAGVSAVFWSIGEFLDGPENWEDILQAGADLFEREFLPDSIWKIKGALHSDLTPDVARLAIAIAGRATVSVPLVHLTENELRLLVPKGSNHEREALDLLVYDGMFGIAPGLGE
jgi:hypothetical protein